MTDDEICLLKASIDKHVAIETTFGEKLVAKIVFVTHDDEYDEHDVLYTMVSTNMPEWYARHSDSGGFVLDFEEIVSVKAVFDQPA